MVSPMSLGHNMDSDGTCIGVTPPAVPAEGDFTDNPLLDPILANNGGPTLNHALLDGSPAIDASADGSCPPVDRRGVSRPRGSSCDIGAFER